MIPTFFRNIAMIAGALGVALGWAWSGTAPRPVRGEMMSVGSSAHAVDVGGGPPLDVECQTVTGFTGQPFDACSPDPRSLAVPADPDCSAHGGINLRLTVQACGDAPPELQGVLILDWGTTSDTIPLAIPRGADGSYVWTSECMDRPIDVVFMPRQIAGQPPLDVRASLAAACCDCDDGTPEPPPSSPITCRPSTYTPTPTVVQSGQPVPLALSCWGPLSVRVTISAPAGQPQTGTAEIYLADGSLDLVEIDGFYQSECRYELHGAVVTVFADSGEAQIGVTPICCKCCSDVPPQGKIQCHIMCPDGYAVGPGGQVMCMCCQGAP